MSSPSSRGGAVAERRGVAKFDVGGKVGGFRTRAPPPVVMDPSILSGASSSSDAEEPAIRGETFHGHWLQMREVAAMQNTVPTGDDMVAVLNLLAQMTSLLQMELEADKDSLALLTREEQQNPLDSIRENKMPCLDLLLSDNILDHVLATSRMPIDAQKADQLRQQQLLLYETLLGSHQAVSLLSHQPFVKPLLELLNYFNISYADQTSSSLVGLSPTSKDSELHLVLVLNQLGKKLLENLDLLDFFFQASQEHRNQECRNNGESEPDSDTSHFLIFSILVKFLHREGHVGQLARDGLLHCVSLSKKNEEVGNYIAKHSNFCTVLATGLSGLYSLLPRHLPQSLLQDSDFHRIRPEDLQEMPELSAFLTSLKFCEAVVQVAHAGVREKLLGLVYMGFLANVMGPALTQSSESELICTTSYLDLFLGCISEPALLQVFLRFLFVETYDDKITIDAVTVRLSSQSKLCQVTLALFETLINLRCEDVLFWLVFRHLIPQRHLVPSQRDAIRYPDLHGHAAERLLSLTPICCQEAAAAFAEQQMMQQRANGTQSSTMSFSQIFSGSSRRNSSTDNEDPSQKLSENFHLYLKDAKLSVRQCFDASKGWQYEYNGIDPPPDAFLKRLSQDVTLEGEISNVQDNSVCDIGPMHSTVVGDTTAPSSGYTSLAIFSSSPSVSGSLSGPVSLTADEDREFWNLMKDPTVSELRLNRVIQRMQHHDELSLSSAGNLSRAGSNAGSERLSPREKRKLVVATQQHDEVDYTVTSLGCFLDLLYEKVELMSSNTMATNLLVTSILSNLASFPQPLLRSVLVQTDIVFQPSVRCLFTAIASLRQKLDNVMPTLTGADEAIMRARRFLQERAEAGQAEGGGGQQGWQTRQMQARRESNISSTISHLGHEAFRHRSSLSAAFNSMFRSKKFNSSAPASIAANDESVPPRYPNLTRDVKAHALAAVLLEEWLQELAAIAQEHSVLQKEQVFETGMGLTNATKRPLQR